jgi:hypothetical protein
VWAPARPGERFGERSTVPIDHGTPYTTPFRHRSTIFVIVGLANLLRSNEGIPK